MRILFITCFTWIIFNSREVKGGDCDHELGMQSKAIPDANIRASSSLSSNHAPALARLDGQGAWCSARNDNSPYIQIQLGKKKSITMIMTQGSFEDLRWATKYQIKYLKEGKWVTYRKADGTLTLQGNQNPRRLEDHDLQPPIPARSIRVYPMMPKSVTPNETLKKVSCLRLELYGCSAPVNGGWGKWGRWSECSVTCGPGMRSRERKCDSPKPENGGEPCNETERVEEEKCNKQNCPVIDGDWGEWGRWSECSLTCGLGMRSRGRKCDSPKPQNGGMPCNEAARVQMRYCRNRKCGHSRGGDYGGYSGSGHGWETYSDDGREHGDESRAGDSSGSSEDGWYTYSKNTIWSDNDDEDYGS